MPPRYLHIGTAINPSSIYPCSFTRRYRIHMYVAIPCCRVQGTEHLPHVRSLLFLAPEAAIEPRIWASLILLAWICGTSLRKTEQAYLCRPCIGGLMRKGDVVLESLMSSQTRLHQFPEREAETMLNTILHEHGTVAHNSSYLVHLRL